MYLIKTNTILNYYNFKPKWNALKWTIFNCILLSEYQNKGFLYR